MGFVDMPRPSRVNRRPDGTVLLLESDLVSELGFTVHRVELRQYVERVDAKLGPYSLITSVVSTDRGKVEMAYDEGYRGNDALDEARKFLASNLGLSGLLLRSIISIDARAGPQHPS